MVKRRILIVDHDDQTLHALAHALRRADFSVTCNPDPHAALAVLDQTRPDALVVATVLPYLDGFEFVRRVHNEPAFEHVPVIFITNAHDACVEDRAASVELGAADYLEKPLVPADVAARLHAIIQQPAAHATAPDAANEFSGTLGDLDVAALCNMMLSGKKSGTLMLRHHVAHGFVYFLNGQIIDAEVAQLHGSAAVYQLVRWHDGDFCMSFGVPDRPVALTTPTHVLLLEGMRRFDEFNRWLKTGTGPTQTTPPAAPDAAVPDAAALEPWAAAPKPRTPEEAFGLTPAPLIDQSYLDAPLPAPPPWHRATFWLWTTSIATLLAGLLWNLTQR